MPTGGELISELVLLSVQGPARGVFLMVIALVLLVLVLHTVTAVVVAGVPRDFRQLTDEGFLYLGVVQ